MAALANSALRQATPADRKQQLKQLAEMEVAIPEEFRREMAMAGDWQTLSERAIYDDLKQEDDGKEFKPDALNIGVRKRKFEGQEEGEEAEERVARKAWGSTTRTYPSVGGDVEDDLDSLLKSTKVTKPEDGALNEDAKLTGLAAQPPVEAESLKTENAPFSRVPLIKKEDSDTGGVLSTNIPDLGDLGETSIKTEDGPTDTGVVFKKRKAKQIRQRG